MAKNFLTPEPPHVVILGGGFAGLNAARVFDNQPVRVTVVDRANHHLFQPLLYQVAMAALSAPDIAAPIRRLLQRQQNTQVVMAEIDRVDVESRTVHLSTGPLRYDQLIVATGMTHSYFGHDAWAAHAPGLKTLGDALEIRSRVLGAFEAAERETDEAARRALLSFVVIGGGPTGVELAGALAEIAGRTLAQDFRTFNPATARVTLVEAGPRLLPSFPENLSARAQGDLQRLGVSVLLGRGVSDVNATGVQVGESFIAARTVLWAAGVQASHITRQLGAPIDRAGRVQVLEDLTLPDRPEVFVVGDLIARAQDGKPLPGVAQLALQSGRYAAEQIVARLGGRSLGPFVYRDKGSMATIGRHRAVAQVGRLKMWGVAAWWLWLLVHVMSLVDFRNRIAVLMEWAWAYLTWDRHSRVILPPPKVPAALERSTDRQSG